MTTSLDVVNDCLAIMGEAPLNALAEEHSLKPAALNILDRNHRKILAEGWWFNTEDLKLLVNPVTFKVGLPGDFLTFRTKNSSLVRGSNGAVVNDGTDGRSRYVQRGAFLYDTRLGTNLFDAGFSLNVQLIRNVPLEDCPVSVQEFVARKSVLDFQNEYDGDSTKTRDLKQEVFGIPGVSLGLRGFAVAEHVRNTGFNFIVNSERLSRITNTINYSRRPR